MSVTDMFLFLWHRLSCQCLYAHALFCVHEKFGILDYGGVDSMSMRGTFLLKQKSGGGGNRTRVQARHPKSNYMFSTSIYPLTQNA
jgi:hypothetical protein